MAATTYPHLLPANATKLERALAGPIGRINAIPVNIDKLYRWDTCPTAFLPWLAWANSVDIWDDDWPEEQKRNLIRESFDLHRRKGSLYAIERYIHYAGGTLLRSITPPDKCFVGNSMTDPEREDWLSRFPQIRIFNFRSRGEQTFGAFSGKGGWMLGKTFLGAGPAHVPPQNGTATVATAFPYKTDAIGRYGRRAFLWDKGSHYLATGLETPLSWAERTRIDQQGIATTYEQVLIPGTKVKGFFVGDSSTRGNAQRLDGRRFLMESAAGARIVSVALQNPFTTQEDLLLRRNSVPPSLEPIAVFPKQVAEPGVRVKGQLFAGMTASERWLNPVTQQRKVIKGFVGGFLPPTTAGDRIYDRIDLHDPNRLPDKRGATTFIGNVRLGMPAYMMQLDVEIRGKRPLTHAGRFLHGHLVTSDQKVLKRVMGAVVSAKSDRDKVLIRTSLHRPPSSSDGYTTASGLKTNDIVLAL